jgi:hypothetical protein
LRLVGQRVERAKRQIYFLADIKNFARLQRHFFKDFSTRIIDLAKNITATNGSPVIISHALFAPQGIPASDYPFRSRPPFN